MRNLIFVKYDITQTELIFAQFRQKHLQCACRHTKSYPISYNLINMVIIELYRPRATHLKYIGGNEEFSKSKTTKLFYFTRDSRLIFQS